MEKLFLAWIVLSASNTDDAFDDCLFLSFQKSFPKYPCHLTVHPPHCMPMLSKFLNNSTFVNLFILTIIYPTITTYLIESNNPLTGRMLEFFKTTKDSLTEFRLSMYSLVDDVKGNFTSFYIFYYALFWVVINPMAIFTVNILVTAYSNLYTSV